MGRTSYAKQPAEPRRSCGLCAEASFPLVAVVGQLPPSRNRRAGPGKRARVRLPNWKSDCSSTPWKRVRRIRSSPPLRTTSGARLPGPTPPATEQPRIRRVPAPKTEKATYSPLCGLLPGPQHHLHSRRYRDMSREKNGNVAGAPRPHTPRQGTALGRGYEVENLLRGVWGEIISLQRCKGRRPHYNRHD